MGSNFSLQCRSGIHGLLPKLDGGIQRLCLLLVNLRGQLSHGRSGLYGFAQAVLGLLRGQDIGSQHPVSLTNQGIQGRLGTFHVVGP